MSARVEQMFSVRQAVWWQGTSEDRGQARILGDHPTWEQARALAGLAWDPTEDELYRRSVADDALRKQFAEILLSAELGADAQVDALLAAHTDAVVPVRGWKHIGRDDEPAATLACTMDSYAVITNSAFGEIFEAVLDQRNVKFETGGCLEDGKQVWMLCVLDEPITLPGDNTTTMPYLALMSRHDAQGATTLRPTAVRIVCQNTFNLAELSEGWDVRKHAKSRGGASFSFVHRGDWRARVEEAREAVGVARREMRVYADLATELLGVRVTAAQERLFIAEFIPMPPTGLVTDRVRSNVEEARGKLTQLVQGSTIEGAGCRGTVYGLVQGAGEYLDHVRRSRSWETRMNRSLMRPEPLKHRALTLAREVATIRV